MGAEFILEGGVSLRGGPLGHIVRLRVGDVIFRLRITEHWERGGEAESTASSRQTHIIEFLDYSEDDLDHEFDHVPYEDDRFAWAAEYFVTVSESTLAAITVLVHGEQVPVQPEQLRRIETGTMVGPIWCPVANMKAERAFGPGGVEVKRGSKHFAPGAKLYCDRASWGAVYYDQIQVVGHHRASHRYVTMIVSSSWLTNWRVELAYSPYVIRAFWPRWDGTAEGKERAQEIVDMMREFEAAGK